MNAQNVIETDALTKQFGPVTAIDGIDLAVQSGEVFELLGPNGAGKFDDNRPPARLTTPTESQVRVFKKDIAEEPRAVRRRLGFFPRTMTCTTGWLDGSTSGQAFD